MLKPKKKLTRREIKQDKLVTTWFKINDYLNRHYREVILGAMGVVLVIGLIILFRHLKSRDEQIASEKFVQARAEYNNQNYEVAIPILEKLVGEYGGTSSAGIARIYLANAYMLKKDYANAEKFYQQYLDQNHDDPILGASAAYGLAATHEERGDYAKAAKLYEEAANTYAKSYRAPQLLITAARCYKQAGQPEGARRALQKLLDKYPKSGLIEDAKLLLAETGS
ncbi:MAG: tetratricopeptide repeat protein [candidate division KSB1 bacterium]|nr:tetratricopeptide repeat protein [candidate division KSB1 bacterium]MDZ7305205.1 tetratricopeptide repeat protein [candidate division KSB1 bacterium]MDZ7314316.1 tetratricopeptide repeat protein [candidate division KSB1 bacterium]